MMANEKRKDDGVAKWLWWVLAGSFLAFMFIFWWIFYPAKPADNTTSSIISKTVTNLSYGAPVEIARLVICGCESGCKQFEADGKTPLRNKERASSASGKYQFLEEHRKLALDLTPSLNLDTEEGQDGYFVYRYQTLGLGTKDWEADPRSVACWEPKLKSYAFGGGEAIVLVVEAPVGDNKWSEVIPLPRNGERGGRHSIDGFGKKYTVRWNNGRADQIDEDLPRPEGLQKKKPAIVYDFRLRSRESEVVPITAKFF